MLVCSVSARPQRIVAVITAEAGAAAAADVVQMPGLGQLVSEAASVADAVNAESIYNMVVVEGTSALDSVIGYKPGPVAAAIVETATADGEQDFAPDPVARSAMLGPVPVFVNSDGAARQVNADGVMVNL